MMTNDVLSPVYAADLRALIKQYIQPGSPVSDFPPPGGSFADRVAGYYRHLSAGSISMQEDSGESVTAAHARAYFTAAVGDRLFAIEPMLGLASLEIDKDVRISIEAEMLRILAGRYGWLPFPFRMLHILQLAVDEVPDHPLVSYLDGAWHVINTSSTVGEAMRDRPDLRIECLRMGTSRSLSDFQVGLAELLTDVLLLARAAREDIEIAAASAGDHGGSVSLALRQRDADADLVTESVLPMLLKHPVEAIDVERDEITSLATFAASRHPLWQDGLLPSSRRIAPAVVVRTEAPPPAKQDPDPLPESPPDSTESGQAAYRRILAGLEKRIIGAPEASRMLAVIGLAHERGVIHQRVLISGATGSGKTHAVKALAATLGSEHMQIDMSEITGVGWRGGELNLMVEALVSRKGGSKGILQLDEADKIRLAGDGNTFESRMDVQTAMLALLDGQPITPDGGSHDQVETSGLLIIATGAFGGRFTHQPPTTQDLVRYGWIPELAARWGERMCMPVPDLRQMVSLLRGSERSVGARLGPLLASLGLEVIVSESALAYAASAWLSGGGDFRSAAELLLATARARIIDALETGSTEPIVIAPDDLRVPRRRIGRDLLPP
jgi:hypothetical protein